MRQILFCFLSAVLFFSCKQKEQSRPNIVIILADDLGYGDPQIYNSESKIPTPNIDQLARAGMRFTDAHTPSSVCTPTRYGLLTGRYAWRTALKSSVLWTWDPPLIAKDRLTIPKMLKKQNYHSACIGKWHLGWRWASKYGNHYANDSLKIGVRSFEGRHDLWKQIDLSAPIGGGPLEAGFHYYFGDDVPNFAPYTFFENNQLLAYPGSIKPDTMFGNPGPMVEGWDLEQVMPAITEKAVEYIQEQAQESRPFFLYFSLTAPHTPIAPTKEFQGKSEAGLYGDFVHEVDWSVGQVVEALQQSGVWENTLLIFTSDNGSPQRDGSKMNGKTGSVKAYGHNPSRPWKGMKGDIWEGGHRVPFIVSWPEQIQAGQVTHQLIGQTDIMATLADILGVNTESGSMEDSQNFSSLLFGNQSLVRESIFHHSLNGTFAIRKGDWKLILGKDSGGFSRGLEIEGIPVETEGQLYNLKEDPGESNNLYASSPAKVEELLGIYLQEGLEVPEG
ncbi:MAG: arylsulfatase [Bacteroidota bacterium]